jgi:hypothetical protein
MTHSAIRTSCQTFFDRLWQKLSGIVMAVTYGAELILKGFALL